MESIIKGQVLLNISLNDLNIATNNFSDKNFIGQGGYGKVYTGNLSVSGQQKTVAIKRLERTLGQGEHEFMMEIQMLSCYRHKNIIPLIGYCDDKGEKILVYEHAKYGSLDQHISESELSWIQRLQIALGAARGISYLHNDVGPQHRVLHRDIKSANILLNENWEAMISDFGLSKIGPANVDYTFLVSRPCGTIGYADPQYFKSGVLTKESDVYSFGVVLLEILCGRPTIVNQYEDERRSLASLAQQYFEQKRLHDIIHPNLKNEMKEDSLEIYSTLAYECLKDKRSERPTMALIVRQLEKALKVQACSKVAGLIRVGTWGRRSEDWSFQLEKDHKLQKITIEHDDIIRSLMFTSESCGVLQMSSKVGVKGSGEIISEVSLDSDEEIVGINGTIGTQEGYLSISSLSFETTKRTHGPFGQVKGTVFSLRWEDGSLAGFYGLATDHFESIGIYARASTEIIKVGTWGSDGNVAPYARPPNDWSFELYRKPNDWSFELKRNHHLKKITVGHGDLIYSLMFTTEYRGVLYTSEKSGGWDGVEKTSEVIFDRYEELRGINGTIGISRGKDPGYTAVSSISFVTDKRTHGPFGNARGTPFALLFDEGSFAGCYGLCSWYLDSIGVYLKATA